MKASHCDRIPTVIASVTLMVGGAAIASAVAVAVAVAAAPGADTDTEQATSVRLSPSQYKHTIADIFDGSININGNFEPEQRDQGSLAIGARTTNVSDNGTESYDAIARAIASQVVDTRHRMTLIGCVPHSLESRDDSCARSFFARVGPLLYRRSLTDDEVQAHVSAAGKAADMLHDFYSGVRLSLAEMLLSPEVLFRFARMEPDPMHPGQQRLNAYDKASKLSFFLWDTTPDPELMEAAQSGQLDTKAGLIRQVNRLIESPRVADGIRALFSDMLGFDGFDQVSKDPSFFPLYTPSIKEEAQEQTLRTVVDHIVHRHSDYRDLFTTPHTFLTRDLAGLYGVPLVDTTPNAQPQRWVPFTYPVGDPRVGIISQASFTTLWSPAGRTSPTVRGKALRQNLLCEKVPPPPGNVSFKFVEDTSNPQFKTARERLTVHRAEPMCAGCHRLTDPLGLALENFNAAGEYRTTENEVPIDATGELNGRQFEGPEGLGKAVRDDPATTSCIALRAFASETGYMPPTKDARWQEIQRKFSASHYDVLELLRAIALSDLSYDPAEPQVLAVANH